MLSLLGHKARVCNTWNNNKNSIQFVKENHSRPRNVTIINSLYQVFEIFHYQSWFYWLFRFYSQSIRQYINLHSSTIGGSNHSLFKQSSSPVKEIKVTDYCHLINIRCYYCHLIVFHGPHWRCLTTSTLKLLSFLHVYTGNLVAHILNLFFGWCNACWRVVTW